MERFISRDVILLVAVALCSILPVTAQMNAGNAPDPPWKVALYEKDVEYGRFACAEEYRTIVDSFFVKSPLRSFLSVCHNDCPIVTCIPVVNVPIAARAVKAAGKVRVHVLVDEQGKVLYARALEGNPHLRPVSVRAACRTQFWEYPHHKTQGIMDFKVEAGDEYVTASPYANRVIN